MVAAKPHLGAVGATAQHKAGPAVGRGDVGVEGGRVSGILEAEYTQMKRVTLRARPEVFQQHRHSTKGSVGEFGLRRWLGLSRSSVGSPR